MAEAEPTSTPPAKSYSSDPALYLYTSLTSGSSHIVTATSRLETILKANRVPFKALDIATDEKARMLWGRRAGKDEGGRVRKIPGLVQMGLVLGDLVEIEDWNEYGELKQHVKIYYDAYTTPAKGTPTPTPNITPAKKTPLKAAAATSSESSSKPLGNTKSEPVTKAETKKEPEEPQKSAPIGGMPTAFTLAMKQAGEEAAKKAKEGKKKAVQVFDGTGDAAPKEPAKKPAEEPTVEPAKEPAKEPAEEPVKEAAKKPVEEVAEESAEESAEEPAKELTKEPEKEPAKEPSKEPAEKPTEIPAKEPAKEETETKSAEISESAATPVPALAALEIQDHPIHHTEASTQSPTATAWKTPGIPTSKFSPVGPLNADLLESPNATWWKPTDIEPPVMHHRGSEVEEASAEEIRAIEKAQAIKEEDEESDEEAVED